MRAGRERQVVIDSPMVEAALGEAKPDDSAPAAKPTVTVDCADGTHGAFVRSGGLFVRRHADGVEWELTTVSEPMVA